MNQDNNSLNNNNNTEEDLGIYMSESFLQGINLDAFKKDMEKVQEDKKEKLLSIRKELTTLTNSIYSLPDQLVFRSAMGDFRMIEPSLLEIAKSFYVEYSDEHAEELFGDKLKDTDYGLLSSQGNARFLGRYVYPVMGFYNEVIGFIGYDNESDVKYLRSNTMGFEKDLSFYGMQMMRYIYNKRYCVVQEGIVDALWGWSIDEPFIGTMGDSLSDFLRRILKRFGPYTVLIPDNDDAGRKAYEYKWSKYLPDASSIRLKGVKDIDEWRKEMLKRGYTPDQVKLIFKSIVNDILNSAMVGVPKHIELGVWE